MYQRSLTGYLVWKRVLGHYGGRPRRGPATGCTGEAMGKLTYSIYTLMKSPLGSDELGFERAGSQFPSPGNVSFNTCLLQESVAVRTE